MTKKQSAPPADPVGEVAAVGSERMVGWFDEPPPVGTKLYAAPPADRVALTDEHIETFVTQYNDVYCFQRRAGVGGGDAERAAMKEVLLLAIGALAPPSDPDWRRFEPSDNWRDNYAAPPADNRWEDARDTKDGFYAPPADRAERREPIPDYELVTMYAENPTCDADMIAFAREVEKAHGICCESESIRRKQCEPATAAPADLADENRCAWYGGTNMDCEHDDKARQDRILAAVEELVRVACRRVIDRATSFDEFEARSALEQLVRGKP